MNEVMEKAKFLMKPFALAKSSRQYIERLWKVGIDVSKFGVSISSFFSSIFNTMVKAVMRVAGFSRGIRELSLTRFTFLPPFDLWSRRVPPPEEEYLPTEMGRANVSFLFNVTVARKTAAELARRLATKTPKSALVAGPVPLPEAELIGETVEERVEELAKTVPHIVADLQSRFKSKLAPSMKGIASALQEYGRQTILLAPLLAMPKPLLVGPTRLEGPPSHLLVAPPEKEAPQVGLPERPLAVRSFGYATGLPSIVLEREIPVLRTMSAFPQVSAPVTPLPSIKPSYRHPRPTSPQMRPSQIDRLLEEIFPSLTLWVHAVSSMLRGTTLSLPAVSVALSAAQRAITKGLPPTFLPTLEPPLPSAKPTIRMTTRPVSMPVERLSQDVVSSLEYTTKLPSIVLEQEIPILKATPALSLVSPPKPPLLSIEHSYRYPKPTTLPPMSPSQIDRVIKEISPSLTSWIYEVSEILRDTTLSLSAVPVAASTAERVITETLIQPVSSLETPRTLGTQEPVSPGLTPSRPEGGVGRVEVKAFRLPAIVTSLIFALSQRYPLLFSEPTIGETHGASFELIQVAPEEPPALGRMPESKSLSKLPTVIALAAAQSLIAQRLHHEFGALTREMQVARSSYGERLGELGASGPLRTTMLGKLRAAAPTLPPTLGPYVPRIPSAHARASAPPPLTRLGSISPSIQNTFNITVSAESAEEDLRDLERKINKILSEQIRRYYGSPRV